MRSGIPLREYLLAKKFDAGIEIRRTMPEAVPEFECREAAVYVNVTWDDWIHKMDGYERACAVAHYRVSLSLKAHVDDAAEHSARRKASRASRKQQRRTAGSPVD